MEKIKLVESIPIHAKRAVCGGTAGMISVLVN